MMDQDSGAAAPEALLSTITHALRRHARHSAHPADQAALRHAAARIALALAADFVVIARHSSAARLTDRQPLNEDVHE